MRKEREGTKGEMEQALKQEQLLEQYLQHYRPLIGDKRTGDLLRGTVQGIIGAQTLACSQIAASSPTLATEANHGERRIRRMANGETGKRSQVDADHLIERLQAHGVEQLREEEMVWVIVDPSELRKPYAREMESLMQVRALKGGGTVAGYRTLNVLGVGRGGRRGILYHRLFSSQADDFLSESKEIRQALDSVGAALTAQAGKLVYIVDTQFDDEAVWGAVWEQDNHLVCRLKHQERLVEQFVVSPGQPNGEGTWVQRPIAEAKSQLQEIVRVRTEMLVRKKRQKRAKRQPVTAVIATCPLRVHYQVDVRTRGDGPVRQKEVWLIEVKLENVEGDPWLLLTDLPVVNEQDGLRVFRMYRERWAVEDCFKFTKQVLGWEDVQLLSLEGVRTLVALAWVAAGFLYELGVTTESAEVHLLARLGGWVKRTDRRPGKITLTRGLQRLLDHMVTAAILQDEIARHGPLPPRIAAFLDNNTKAS